MSTLSILLLLAAVAAVGIAIYTLLNMVFGKTSDLDDVLDTYFDNGEFDQAGDSGNRPSTSAIMKAAVDRTERFAERRGVLDRIEGSLRAGQVPLRAAEAIVFWVVAIALLTVAATLLSRNILVGLGMFVFALIIPPLMVKRAAVKYNKRFTAELPDMLQLLASTLRAGYSLMQGFEAVAKEVDEGPVAEELDLLITESRLGRPMDEALKASAERVDTDDWTWSVMAIEIQREVGGNLAELLITVSETMIARERLRREVQSLTAEGRISAYMLGLMPLVLGVIMWVLNPEYIGLLFQRQIGWMAMGGAAVLMGVGFLWMNKIIDIEV